VGYCKKAEFKTLSIIAAVIVAKIQETAGRSYPVEKSSSAHSEYHPIDHKKFSSPVGIILRLRWYKVYPEAYRWAAFYKAAALKS